jgi:hypothetical protein
VKPVKADRQGKKRRYKDNIREQKKPKRQKYMPGKGIIVGWATSEAK